ncbi:polysaccharide pyruvyl transferase WcaK-like protein [Phenylobacterium koreense]|uniref:Polysaccharide pyruvyl transferase WcaK-like protein n=1 Tax=Phenylobacterium koreense TaxID=266125 RepID=A0ABV2EM54_9CAUL
MTLANLAIARQVAEDLDLEPEFMILGMREGEISYLNDPRVTDFTIDTRSLLSPSGFWSAIGDQDCVLDIGAGDSFADIYGPRRFAFLWLTKMMTIARRIPLLLSPQTIGPFTKPAYRPFAKVALSRADTVVARDQLSLDVLRQLAPTAKGLLSVDVAFALPYVDRSAERGGAKVRVGVNVSGLLFNEADSGRNRFGLEVHYAELMRRLLRDIEARPDMEAHLITHATHPHILWDDDRSVADKLAEEFPSAVRVADFAGPSEAKSYISAMDFLIAGRMHACIAALSSGTPVVPVAYSRKFSGLFGMLGYGWMIPVTGTSTDEALVYLHDCIARRDLLARDSLESFEKARGPLGVYADRLRDLFSASVSGA